jgi:hypothetical protein
MGLIHSENWDSATAPTMPAGWIAGLDVTTTISGATALSSPNMVENFGYSPSTATWETLDGNAGNVTVAGTGQAFGAATGQVSVFARSNATPTVYGTSTFLELRLSWSASSLSLVKNVGATATTIGSVTGITLADDLWYQLNLTAIGSALTGTLQRLSDGTYWYAGAWNTTPGTALSETDGTITSAGYSGWGASATGANNIYGDNWSLSTAGGFFATAALAVATGGDRFAGSASINTPASSSLAHTAAGDVLAATAGFKDPASLAHTTAGDVLTASARFTAHAGISHTTAGDVLASSALFTDHAALAHTTAGDVLVGSPGFKSPATLNHVSGGDVFASASHSLFAVLTAVPSGDVANASAHETGGTLLGALEHHDAFAIFALVSPRVQATEHADRLAASLTAGTPPPATLAHTTAGDTFGATAGFTFDTRFALTGLEHPDRLAGVAIQSSAASLGAVATGDAFAGVTHTADHATLGAVGAGDRFAGGLQRVEYAIFSNSGSGPISYVAPIATTAALTWTSGPLTFPDTWAFGVRAFFTLGGLEETNLDCAVQITLSATGTDVTNVPPAPLAIRAFATAGGGIRVEWFAPPVYGANAPTGYHIYLGSGSSPNYGVVAAVVLYSTAIGSNLVANIAGLTGGVLYQVGVRAYNATGEEQNTNTVSVMPISVGPLPVQNLVGVATSQGA